MTETDPSEVVLDRSTPPPPPPKKRLTLVDFALFAIVLAVIAYTIYRVNSVLVYRWDWQAVFDFILRYDPKSHEYVPNLLLYGLGSTLRLAIWATIVASIVGLIMGYWRTSANLTLRIISRLYVELIRNLPPLVFIFIFYFFISSQIFPALGLESISTTGPWVDNTAFHIIFGDPSLLSNFLAGALCLSLFEGAYFTEIVRAGIQSIPVGQWEAARAIGLSRVAVLRYVIFPQALRKILPPLASQFITLIKDSSIVSLISIQELTFMGTEVSATNNRVFETWIVVGAMYFVLCYSFAFVFGRLERRAARIHR